MRTKRAKQSPFLYWNRQILSNFNTSEIIFEDKIFGGGGKSPCKKKKKKTDKQINFEKHEVQW